MPATVKTAPAAMLAQKTVERSAQSGAHAARWPRRARGRRTRARTGRRPSPCPRARSRAATAAGRARATAIRDAWKTICEAAFHPSPRSTRPRMPAEGVAELTEDRRRTARFDATTAATNAPPWRPSPARRSMSAQALSPSRYWSPCRWPRRASRSARPRPRSPVAGLAAMAAVLGGSPRHRRPRHPPAGRRRRWGTEHRWWPRCHRCPQRWLRHRRRRRPRPRRHPTRGAINADRTGSEVTVGWASTSATASPSSTRSPLPPPSRLP